MISVIIYELGAIELQRTLLLQYKDRQQLGFTMSFTSEEMQLLEKFYILYFLFPECLMFRNTSCWKRDVSFVTLESDHHFVALCYHRLFRFCEI